ncbi:hypothetical protein E2562_025324 [Oryza meyeriana var. granulata]|uniref:Uncharacterized protein n=1 Tax=Oryza meyeriana var. granulata TaxID=110450 RepID=A0A6G1EPC5_9ORYZ|nr:hypothetical protein E2562_025324 [Oryza meyeriana var. granulata]
MRKERERGWSGQAGELPPPLGIAADKMTPASAFLPTPTPPARSSVHWAHWSRRGSRPVALSDPIDHGVTSPPPLAARRGYKWHGSQ